MASISQGARRLHSNYALRKEQAYVSYAQYNDLPATSFDFGDDGFAGSCNYGGEILQLSARTDSNDLVFARGKFQPTLYTTLARAQQEFGGVCTFGLKLKRNSGYHPRNLFGGSDTSSSFRLGRLLDRGCFNYRWPLHEYSLYLNSDSEMGCEKSMWERIRRRCLRLEREGKIPKSLCKSDFLGLVDAIFKQWMKEWNEESAKWNPKMEEVRAARESNFLDRVGVLAMSPAKEENGKLQTDKDSKTAPNGRSAPSNTTQGQDVRQMGSRENEVGSTVTLNRTPEREIGTCVTFSFVKDRTVYQVLRIEQGGWTAENVGEYVLFPAESQVVLTIGGPIRFDTSDSFARASDEEGSAPNLVDLSRYHYASTKRVGKCQTLRLSQTNVQHRLEARIYQLVDCAGHETTSEHKPAGSNQCYLLLDLEQPPTEISQGVYEALVKLPSQRVPRAERSATFIAALRLREEKLAPYPEETWHVPDPQTIYEHICSDAIAGGPTALMWEKIYFYRSLLRQPFSRISDVHLIGRALEKILQVDMVPLKCPTRCTHPVDTHPSALISNIFVSPAVDYKSLL